MLLTGHPSRLERLEFLGDDEAVADSDSDSDNEKQRRQMRSAVQNRRRGIKKILRVLRLY